MKILDVGCGIRKATEAIGIDKFRVKGVDVVHDLEKFPWPFKDNTFDKIICNHILEHLTNLTKTMEELHRIAKSNAKIEIEVPYYKSELAFADPTHKHFITPTTFDFFTEMHENKYYSKARFKIEKKKLIRCKHRVFPDFFFGYERMKVWLNVIK